MSIVATRPRGLGSILSDITSVAGALTAGLTPGGLTSWFQQQIATLNGIPNDTTVLQQQITAVTAIIAAAGNDATATSALTAAQANVSNMIAQFPAVNSAVGQAMVTLTPLLGSSSSSMLLPLLSNSPALIGAFDGLTTLVSMRDDARTQLQAITTDSNLSPAVQAQVAQALAANATAPGTGMSALTWAVLLGGGFLAYKLVRKVV